MRNYSGGGAGGSSTPDFHGFYQKDAARGGQRYYPSGALIADNLTSLWMAQGAGVIYAVPLLSTRGATVTSLNTLAGTIWGAVNKTGRMGIYTATNQTTHLYPDALVADAGPVLLTAAALMTWPMTVVLDPGVLYWAVLSTEVTIGVYYLSAYCAWAINGSWSCTATNNPSSYWYANFAYGALPATFPTAGAAAGEGAPPLYAATFA